MAKANVNTASREQLVEAGLRAELADEVLKLRRKGKVGPEALDELPGVNSATHAQLRSLLDFSDQAGSGGGAEEATHEATEAAHGAMLTIHRATGAAGVVTLQWAEGPAELGQALVDLVQEHTRHNFETWTAFASAVDWDQAAKAVDWSRVVQIQTEYLRASLERAAGLSQRYLEAAQAVMATAVNTTRDQAEAA